MTGSEPTRRSAGKARNSCAADGFAPKPDLPVLTLERGKFDADTGATVVELTDKRSAPTRTIGRTPLYCAAYAAFYFEIVIGIPTFSTRPMVV